MCEHNKVWFGMQLGGGGGIQSEVVCFFYRDRMSWSCAYAGVV
jgi:hypothetical protein